MATYEMLLRVLANLETSKAASGRQLSLGKQKFELGQLDALSLQKSRDDFDEISNSILDFRIQLKKEQVLLERLDGTTLRKFKIE